MKLKSKKSALLMSFTSLLLCFAMLAGSTFAWFTDTATTGVNKIQAGNLDVELLMYKEVGGVSDYVNISKAPAPIFGSENSTVAQNNNLDTLWEPGKTQVAYLAIKNEGNLDLKYQVALNVTNLADGKDLYQVMQYAIAPDVMGGSAPPAWTAGKSVTPGAQIVSGTNTVDAAPAGVKLLHGSTHYFALLVHMDGDAGNTYQNGKVEFDLKVYATQLNSESDSFGPNYDKDATYPVASNESLADAITNAEAGDVVTVAAGVYDIANIAAGVTISGAGADKTELKAPATDSGSQKTGLVVNEQDVTISNVKITGNPEITSDMYCGVVDVREGGTMLENVNVISKGTLASGIVIKNGVGDGETVTARNCKLDVDYRAFYIVDGANGTIVIDNCDITGQIYALNVNSASSQNLVLQIKNSKLHGWSSYGEIKSASFENVEFSKGESDYDYLRPYADTVLKNCTFDAGFLMGAGKGGFTITLDGCTKNGTPITANNIQNTLLDSTDLQNLKGCTIIVDGAVVTLN